MRRTADAVLEAEVALRRAVEVVEQISDVSGRALRILDDAEADSLYARRDGTRRDFYQAAAGEHLERIRSRSQVMRELGVELEHHLGRVSDAVDRAGEELSVEASGPEEPLQVGPLRERMALLRQLVTLATPMLERITTHVSHAAAAAQATDASTLLEGHGVDRDVSRTNEGAVMMRAVLDQARAHAQGSSTLALTLNGQANPSTAPTPPRPRSGDPGMRL